MPKVSVIIPNYNHARFLRQRIDSVLGQTFQDFELILLDDCSTDDSRAILQSYAGNPRVRLEFNEVNSGSPFKQWNKGVRLASGEYLWIAESDDYADPRLLGKLVPLLESDPQVQLAYCRSWRVIKGDRLSGFGDYHVTRFSESLPSADFCLSGSELCRNYLFATNTIPNASAVLFRRSSYERAGGADENLRLCGDWKLWASMALEGKVAYVSEPLNYYRFHDASVRKQSSIAKSDIGEYLYTSRWVMSRIEAPPPNALKKQREQIVYLWLSAVLSRRLPREAKEDIFRRVQEIDPHPIRSVAWFVCLWVWETTLLRLWYAGLKLTYRLRHASGLTRAGFSGLKAKLGMGKAR